MTLSIDLNADLGENFGSLRTGNDAAMLDIVTSANIACGFHAGDPEQMSEVVAGALKNNVTIGAHPGFNDKRGFGRRRFYDLPKNRLVADLLYQIGALQGIARAQGAGVRQVKLHGALANMACEDFELARTCVKAIASLDRELHVLVMAGTQMEKAARAVGSPMIFEVYADRAYNDDGTLVSRDQPGAMIDNPHRAAERMIEWLETGKMLCASGERIALAGQSICVHGDNPQAVEMARTIRCRLEEAGIRLARVGK